jgi:peptidyl-prolyl cis-trans isomerase C
LPRNYRKLTFVCLFCLYCRLHSTAFSQTPAGPKTPNSPETVVIRIGDLQVTAAEVNRILETMPAQYRPFYSGPGRRQLADIIVKNKLLVKEAERRSLQDKEAVQLDIKIQREALLTVAAQRELEKEMTVSNEEAQKFLDEHMIQYEQAKVRRILICSASSLSLNPSQPADKCLPDQEARAKADEIRQKLLQGADFEEMAAKFSSDSMSSGKGGDLGFIRRGSQAPLIVPPLEQAIFSLNVGATSEVIQTPFGHEIVKVEDKKTPKLDEVRKEIEPQVRKQKIDDLVKEMRSRQAIKIDEAYFRPSQTASSAPAKN